MPLQLEELVILSREALAQVPVAALETWLITQDLE